MKAVLEMCKVHSFSIHNEKYNIRGFLLCCLGYKPIEKTRKE